MATLWNSHCFLLQRITQRMRFVLDYRQNAHPNFHFTRKQTMESVPTILR